MVHQVGEGPLESQVEPLRKMEILGQAGSNCGRAGANQNANAAIPYRPGWNGIEGVYVEHAAAGGNVAVSKAIGTLEGAAIRKIEIPGIIAGAGNGREIRSGFPEADGADGPSAEREVGETVHVRKEFAILTDGKIVDRR